MHYLYYDSHIDLIIDNKVAGKITFSEVASNTYSIDSTFVHEEYRGKGYADLLMQEAYKYLTSKNYKITASCSYANNWLNKN